MPRRRIFPTLVLAIAIPSPHLMGQDVVWDQWNTGGCDGDGNCRAHDYAELRIQASVPAAANGLEIDFAFLSIEYPVFVDTSYNDMFLVWLESEDWTGNISFDDEGRPISLNASFFDYQGSPELVGFAAEGHGATRWLQSSVGVNPGEPIEVVFAIFDLTGRTALITFCRHRGQIRHYAVTEARIIEMRLIKLQLLRKPSVKIGLAIHRRMSATYNTVFYHHTC